MRAASDRARSGDRWSRDGQELTLTRRGFIGAAAGTAAAAAAATWAPSAIGQEPLVPTEGSGSVRDAVSRLDMSVIDPLTGGPLRGGFRGVFEVLAAARIKEIEFAGYGQGASGPITVAQIRALLDEYELKGIGIHRGDDRRLQARGRSLQQLRRRRRRPSRAVLPAQPLR
jgi:hypothetical protein